MDLDAVRRHSIRRRANKTEIGALGRPMKTIRGADYFESLPRLLKAADLAEFIDLVARARKKGRPFHLLLGAHVVKVGLSPVIIDLMSAGIVTGLSVNCAGLIHDLELAFWGGTSEDVQAGLVDGTFGMVAETGDMIAAIAGLASDDGVGLGGAAGRFINKQKAKYRKVSVFAAAHRLDLPITVHIGVGTDIISQQPGFDAARMGAASHVDFRILCSICAEINKGGVAANIGSAVILPEVFLKALTVARNIRRGKNSLTTANFDMIQHYRPRMNIVERPTFKAGKGFNFVGHHEIMIPLLAWGLKKKIKS
ncbi:MAG: hypothetical protein JSW34_07835 [Candidatus Zixiibacteriota bacterium]|nr:MAG: hypothetical protein JSW34_07835 [candidate division Zixibacteria bacterium]